MTLSKFDMLLVGLCLSVVYFLNRGLRTYETADIGHLTGLPTVGASFGHILGGKKVSGQRCPSIVLYSTEYFSKVLARTFAGQLHLS